MGWLIPSEVQPLETRSVGQSFATAVNFLVRPPPLPLEEVPEAVTGSCKQSLQTTGAQLQSSWHVARSAHAGTCAVCRCPLMEQQSAELHSRDENAVSAAKCMCQ